MTVALGRVNDFTAEIRQQLAAEIKAGQALLSASKVDPNWIKIYLISTLGFISAHAASSIIEGLAQRALELILKITGLS